MTEYWNAFLQWLHRVGLHPDREAVEQAARQAGDHGIGRRGGGGHGGQGLSGMDMASLLALAAALGWASGFRLYAVVFLVGLLGATGLVALPGGLHVLHPALLLPAAACCVEFFADKIPGWIRSGTCCKACCAFPPGRRWRPACSVPTAPPWPRWPPDGRHAGGHQPGGQDQHACAHQHQPEPFSNVGASLVEDTTAVGAIWLALAHPLVFGVALVVVVIAMWLVIWALWRFVRGAVRRLRGWFGAEADACQRPRDKAGRLVRMRKRLRRPKTGDDMFKKS
jgi:hypothetical protein